MKDRLYVVIVRKTKEVYAWSEDKELARFFISTRKPGYFKLTSEKFYDNPKYGTTVSMFQDNYPNEQIMMNVLGKGNERIDFATTYRENMLLDQECDKIYERALYLEMKLQQMPLSDEVMEVIDMLAECRRKCMKNGQPVFDSFAIFVKLFWETMV